MMHARQLQPRFAPGHLLPCLADCCVQLRAQHHVALCAHELVGAVDELTTLVRRAYDPNAANNPIQPAAPSPNAAAAARAAAPFAWLAALWPLLSCRDFFAFLAQLAPQVWAALTLQPSAAPPASTSTAGQPASPAAARRPRLLLVEAVTERRRVQFALKYLLVMAVAVSVPVLMMGLAPAGTFAGPPIFFYLAAAVIMRPQVRAEGRFRHHFCARGARTHVLTSPARVLSSKQVETTLNQAVLRVTATCAGILCGWALMRQPSAANNAALVTALVTLVNALMTVVTQTQLRLSAYALALSFTSITLCQVCLAHRKCK